MSFDFAKEIRNEIEKIRIYRRHIHAHPELSFEEYETSRYIQSVLKENGVEFQTFDDINGILATVNGAKSGPCVAFRADFDALALEEENDCDFRSQNDGIMHACGHDMHAAVLLGLASVLQKNRKELAGKIRFIFQHAEECTPGGALSMIERGALEGVDAIFGMHVIANLNVGEIGLADGAMMAAADRFRIDVKGLGGHGAQPHTTVDTLVAGARIVVDLQNIVSRMTDPMTPAVVTVGKFQCGNAFNIIQEHAVLEGTVRTLDENVRARIEKAIRQTAEGVCTATGAGFQFDYIRGYPPLINHKEMTALARTAVKRLGYRPVDVVPAMFGEDFSYYLQKAPGCYFFIGCSNPSKGLVSPNHSPTFFPDEDCLEISALMMLETGLEFLLNPFF